MCSPAGFSSPSPAGAATPFTPSSYSDKKTVFLSDWWLIEADRASEGKRLAVGGFTMRQRAIRIFCSAPIIKRHDAYNLEAADGITIIIQGKINKARMQDNGFPLEVCNRFLIGFPYDWDAYTEEYFKQGSTSSAPSKSPLFDEAPKDSTGTTHSAFPVHLDEFPLLSVINLLTCGRDKLATNFSGHLKKIFMSSSIDSKMQNSPLSTVGDIGKQDKDKNDGNIIESAVSVEPSVHHPATTCFRLLECSTSDERNVLTASTQEKASSTNLREMEMGSQSLSFIDNDENIHLQNSEELNLNAEDPTNSMDSGGKCISNYPLSKGSHVSLLNNNEKMGDDAAGTPQCSEKSVLGLPTSIDWQEETSRTGHVEGQIGGLNCFKMSKNYFPRNAESLSDEIGDLHLSNLEKIENCTIASVENPTAQICSSVEIELCRGLDGKMCPQNEPLVEVIEKQEVKKDSIDKLIQNLTKYIGQKDDEHFSTSMEEGPSGEENLGDRSMPYVAEEPSSVVKEHSDPSASGICTHSRHILCSPGIFSTSTKEMPLGEENLRDKSMSNGTEEQLSVVKGLSYSPLIGICTRSGRILNSSATLSKSVGSKKKPVSTYPLKVDTVSKVYEVADTMQESKKKPNDLRFEEKGLTSTSDHASSFNPHQNLIVSESCISDLSTQGLSAHPSKWNNQLPSASSHATTKELKEQNGLATGHVIVENSSPKIGSSTNLTKASTESNPPVMAHCSEDRVTELTGKNLIKKINHDDGSIAGIMRVDLLSSPSLSSPSRGG
ncbi:hypothetical protein Cni_G11219 [Canna indica]|uniref:SANTA domain-containing protein n=1 Tax=Canna indica TaxID=4628 RepID=A0AAQ3K5W1_9LILI|nr:hypothetical protein Cni_G11219 [Canna indica]